MRGAPPRKPPQATSPTCLSWCTVNAARREADANPHLVGHPQATAQRGIRLDAEIRLPESETCDDVEPVAVLDHGRRKAQLARRAAQRHTRDDRGVPARPGERDRFHPDDRVALRIEHFAAQHVLARALARLVRIHRKRFDRYFQQEAALLGRAAGPDLTLYRPRDDVIVTEARERPRAIDEQADLRP